MFNNILLYQTSRKIFALFLSMFMRMESVEFMNNGSRIPAQKIRSLDLFKGSATLKVEYEGSFGVNSSSEVKTINLNNISFNTKGIYYNKALLNILVIEFVLFSILAVTETAISISG